MHIGLLFGSFNPIHIGHLVIANYMVEFTNIDEVWFVVSPHNPLKQKNSLLKQEDRLHLVNLAIKDFKKFKSSNIEFGLSQPSYTINTLKHLKKDFPKHTFSLIIGEDNLNIFTKSKNYKEILKNYKLYVYPRLGVSKNKILKDKNIVLTSAPVIEISSTFIRESIKAKKDIRFFLPKKVWKYIDKKSFYKK